MPRFVALLRGINVGGNTRIKMADLTALCQGLGYTEVITYLQSGNVIFQAKDVHNLEHATQLEKAIENQLDLKVRVIVKSKADLQRVWNENPFKTEVIEKDRTLFVSFLFEPLPPENRALVTELSSEHEKIEPREYEIYTLLTRTHFPDSHMGKSTLVRRLKIDSTTRNWNTLTALLERM